jgi:hypothetical protein
MARHEEYDEARETYDDSQLDMFVSELLEYLKVMKDSLKHTDSAIITLSWVEERVNFLAREFKQ